MGTVYSSTVGKLHPTGPVVALSLSLSLSLVVLRSVASLKVYIRDAMRIEKIPIMPFPITFTKLRFRPLKSLPHLSGSHVHTGYNEQTDVYDDLIAKQCTLDAGSVAHSMPSTIELVGPSYSALLGLPISRGRGGAHLEASPCKIARRSNKR